MRLHVDQRHERVLHLVRERGSLRVAELAEELGMSAVTLRRDVETLAAQGLVERLHGAVVWPSGASGPAPAAVPSAEGLVVGMVVPTTEYYYADVVRGAREAVEAAGARLTIGLSRYLPDEDEAQARRLLSTGADGLLLTPSWERGHPEPGEGLWAAEQETPVVLVERWAPSATRWRVSTGCARTTPTAPRRRSPTWPGSATGPSRSPCRRAPPPPGSGPVTRPPWRPSG